MIRENEVPTNNIGSGKIAGMGRDKNDDPPMTRKKKGLINSLVSRVKK